MGGGMGGAGGMGMGGGGMGGMMSSDAEPTNGLDNITFRSESVVLKRRAGMGGGRTQARKAPKGPRATDFLADNAAGESDDFGGNDAGAPSAPAPTVSLGSLPAPPAAARLWKRSDSRWATREAPATPAPKAALKPPSVRPTRLRPAPLSDLNAIADAKPMTRGGVTLDSRIVSAGKAADKSNVATVGGQVGFDSDLLATPEPTTKEKALSINWRDSDGESDGKRAQSINWGASKADEVVPGAAIVSTTEAVRPNEVRGLPDFRRGSNIALGKEVARPEREETTLEREPRPPAKAPAPVRTPPAPVELAAGTTVTFSEAVDRLVQAPKPKLELEKLGKNVFHDAARPSRGPASQRQVATKTDAVAVNADAATSSSFTTTPQYSMSHLDANATTTGAARKDADGDGLTNLSEFYARTSPTVPDTDDDGIGDADEDGGRRTAQKKQFGLDALTVEGWVKPGKAEKEAAPVVARQLDVTGRDAPVALNAELGDVQIHDFSFNGVAKGPAKVVAQDAAFVSDVDEDVLNDAAGTVDAVQAGGKPLSRKEFEGKILAHVAAESRAKKAKAKRLQLRERKAVEGEEEIERAEATTEALRAQGDIFKRYKRYADARDTYEKLLLKDPHDVGAIRVLREINGKLLDEATEKRARGEQVGERLAEVRWNWAEPVTPLLAGPAAEDDVQPPAPPARPADPFAAAEQDLRAGNYDQAKGMLNQIILETPDGPEASKARTLVRQVYAQQFAQEAADAADDPLPPAPRVPPPPVNPFVLTEKDNQSTFALEADTAAYTLARRYIRQGYLPPVGVVRMEEFINAFDYNYPRQAGQTFSVHSEAAPAPFGRNLVLLKIGVKGKIIGRDGRKPAHLVFAIDASGSMGREDRMPLIKYALALLLDQLGAKDRISLIAYGTHARLLLEAAPATDRKRIPAALNAIECGASTNILSGIELGYQIAARHFAPGQVNRVILCSDGVANVGPSDAETLLKRVENYRDQGISFTSVGVGAGSYDDHLLEQLANKGDGNYIFIDSKNEAKRVFAENMSATIQMIAKDVKIQVEFDKKRVRRYRLIGYENRAVADKDFRNDAVDAGEIGSGQSATALYELELNPGTQDDLGTVYVRYKDVDAGGVHEFPSRLRSGSIMNRTPERHPRFFLAACVAQFAEILRSSEHAEDGSLQELEQTMIQVANALPLDERVQELLLLVQKAQGLPRAK